MPEDLCICGHGLDDHDGDEASCTNSDMSQCDCGGFTPAIGGL